MYDPLSPFNRPLNVLVAEDNRVNQRVILKCLGKHGEVGKVTIANNGQEAVEHAKREKFDIILMDTAMPVMDGYEAGAAIRQYERSTWKKRTPIIGMIAQNAKSRDCFDAAGMEQEMICKPIKMSDLFDSIRCVLNTVHDASSDDNGGWVMVEAIEDWELVEPGPGPQACDA